MALNKGQLDILRQSLGLSSDLPDSDLEELAKTKAGMEFIKKLQGQGETSFGSQAAGFLRGGTAAIENEPGTKDFEKLFDKLNNAKPAAKDPAKKKSTTESESTALQQLAQYLTQNFANQANLAVGSMGNELASQNQGVTNVVNQELGLSAQTSGNPAIAAATDAYMKAYSAGEGLNSAAYSAMNTANQAYTANAGLYPIANLLTQSLGSGQYKELPASLVNSLPASVRDAIANLGITEQPSGTGEGTPIKTTGQNNQQSQQFQQIIASLTAPSTTTTSNANGALGTTSSGTASIAGS